MSLVVLLPLSIYFNWRLAILLFALCVVFTVLTTLVVRKTYGMQSEVEAHYSDLSARVDDASGMLELLELEPDASMEADIATELDKITAGLDKLEADRRDCA